MPMADEQLARFARRGIRSSFLARLASIVALAVAWHCSGSPAAAGEVASQVRKPNFIIILTDDKYE